MRSARPIHPSFVRYVLRALKKYGCYTYRQLVDILVERYDDKNVCETALAKYKIGGSNPMLDRALRIVEMSLHLLKDRFPELLDEIVVDPGLAFLTAYWMSKQLEGHGIDYVIVPEEWSPIGLLCTMLMEIPMIIARRAGFWWQLPRRVMHKKVAILSCIVDDSIERLRLTLERYQAQVVKVVGLIGDDGITMFKSSVLKEVLNAPGGAKKKARRARRPGRRREGNS